MSRPLTVSIITPSYNQAAFIEKTILSVSQQDYPYLEHIIVDGCSTDGTLQVIEKYKHLQHLVCISEPDNGQAAAINKGFQLARGDVICWLNTDDYYTPQALSTVVRFFKTHPEAVFVYGDAWAMDEYSNNFGLRAHVRPCDYDSLVQKGDFIVQPAAFWRRHVIDDIGLLDETLAYCLDYEYFIRIAKRWSLHYIPECLAYECLHPDAKSFTGGVIRMEEMQAMIMQYGQQQLPFWFRAEAAAYYWYRGIKAILHGNFRSVVPDMQQATRINNATFRFLAYCCVLLVGGMRAIPRFRLISNWLRYQFSLLIRRKTAQQQLSSQVQAIR